MKKKRPESGERLKPSEKRVAARERRREREEGPKPQPRGGLQIPKGTAVAPTEDFVLQARALGIEFEGDEVERLGAFLGVLVAANEQMNLTAITAVPEMWMKHILDSLTLLAALSELPDGARVLVVGTGAGLPGMPLAICLPGLKFTLMDATAKKIDFIRQACEHLGISNVEGVTARAEVAAHDRGEKTQGGRVGGMREQFDVVVARAVGPLATIAELTVPFAKEGGMTYLIKGQRAEEELAEGREALQLLKVVHVGNVDTPTGKIVALEKRVATPKIYPRADGEPKRSPLGIGSDKSRD